MKRIFPFQLVALVVGLASFSPLLGADEPARPKNVPKDATWFNGSWFHVFLGAATWHDARLKCEQLGGQLAVIPNAETEAFVTKLAGRQECWLGATDEKKEGTWVWVDDTKWEFARWGANEPSNNKGAEHYLATSRHQSGWIDAPGDLSWIAGYVCQWKATEATELLLLNLRWQEARARAVQPIDVKYRQELQKLRDQFTKAGKLDEANEVDRELKLLPL